MAYPFKTHQFSIPAQKTIIYTATRQELIFSSTVCNLSADAGTISLWTTINGIESAVEFQRSISGTSAANNQATPLALNKIALQTGDTISASGSGGTTATSNWSESLETNWGGVLESGWGDALEGNGGAGGGPTSTSNLVLTMSILY
jgi:hypothetical protein